MFCQHKVVLEDHELTLYLFLFEQDISLSMMKTIFSHMPNRLLELHVNSYLNTVTINQTYHHFKIVYHSTIIRDVRVESLSTEHLLVM